MKSVVRSARFAHAGRPRVKSRQDSTYRPTPSGRGTVDAIEFRHLPDARFREFAEIRNLVSTAWRGWEANRTASGESRRSANADDDLNPPNVDYREWGHPAGSGLVQEFKQGRQ